jgi:hypothetical protein
MTNPPTVALVKDGEQIGCSDLALRAERAKYVPVAVSGSLKVAIRHSVRWGLGLPARLKAFGMKGNTALLQPRSKTSGKVQGWMIARRANRRETSQKSRGPSSEKWRRIFRKCAILLRICGGLRACLDIAIGAKLSPRGRFEEPIRYAPRWQRVLAGLRGLRSFLMFVAIWPSGMQKARDE